MATTPASNAVKLSVLDGVGLYDRESAAAAVAHSTRAAQLIDRLGYTRLWFTEHHNSRHQMSTSPDLFIAHMAALTESVRVGSGGVMLPNHSPLRVVENFSILEALHPGRIDLGMGRASGTDGITNAALRNSMEPLSGQALTTLLLEVLAFFDRDFPEDHPYGRISPSPHPSLRPDLFMLGSSEGGMQIASQLGLGFAFAGQINPALAVPVLQQYRKNFRPSHYRSEPYSILSIIVVCADTDEEAEYLAAPAELQWARWGTGQIHHDPPTLAEAATHQYTAAEDQARAASEGRFVVGGPERVKAQLQHLAAEAEVDELMTVNMITDHEAQLRSYELLADAFDLQPPAGGRQSTSSPFQSTLTN